MNERNTRSNASNVDCTELDNPVAVPHLGDLDAGDRVLIGDRSRPLTVVDTGVRVMRDPRADTGELRTPVVKLRGVGHRALEGGGLSNPSDMGSNVNAFGYQAGRNNTGEGVILIGQQAGINNSEDDVLLITDRNGETRLKMDLTNGNMEIGGSLSENATLN